MVSPTHPVPPPSPPSWFDQHRYAATERLDFEGWRTQIGTRIFLAGLLESNKKVPSAELLEQFDQHFSDIQSSPFMDIGVADNYASDKAVYPLTFGVANTIVATLTPLSPHRKESCDQKLLEEEQESFAMHAHVTIDLNASKSEIIDDFKELLTVALAENRQRFPRSREPGITPAVTQTWGDHQVLPYQDLLLWHLRQGLTMPNDTAMAAWIFHDSDGLGGKEKARGTREKAASIFSLTTLRQLTLADASPLPNP